MQETWVQSLGWEDPLEKEMATHFIILAWEIPLDRGAWWTTVCGVTNSQTRLSTQALELSFSRSLRLHGLQHARPPCPSLTPGVHSYSRPLSPWCHPAISSSVVPFSSCPQALPASGSFPELTLCMRWPKYWSFSFSIIPSNECSGLISFRMDWLDLLAVQGTLKSLLQHHSSKASILRLSAFFTVQLSHPYTTTGKTIALTRGYLMNVFWKNEGMNHKVSTFK